jgi:hypothetical protein
LLIYYFYGRTHSRIAEKVHRDKQFSWRDMLEFFGIFALVNGVLFGLFSVLAITGLTSLKTWDEINLEPLHTLLVCVILIIAGTVVFLAGRINNRGEKRHGNHPSPVS